MRKVIFMLAALAPIAAVAENAKIKSVDCVPGQELLSVNIMALSPKPEDDIATVKAQIDAQTAAIESIAKASGVSSLPAVSYIVRSQKKWTGGSGLFSGSKDSVSAAGSAEKPDEKSLPVAFNYNSQISFTVGSDEQGMQFIQSLGKKGYPSTFSHEITKCH